jgi:hypothetical protein
MKLPRDVGANQLIKALRVLGSAVKPDFRALQLIFCLFAAAAIGFWLIKPDYYMFGTGSLRQRKIVRAICVGSFLCFAIFVLVTCIVLLFR